jgi:hypothetical protein
MKMPKNNNSWSVLILVWVILWAGVITVACSQSETPTQSPSLPASQKDKSFSVIGSRTSYPEALKKDIKSLINKNPTIKDEFPEIKICKTDSKTDPYFLIIGIRQSYEEAIKLQGKARKSLPVEQAKKAWVLSPKDNIHVQEDSCESID